MNEEAIRTYLERVTPFGFAGAVLLAREGKVLINQGYGLAERATGIPNTAETVFNTGSVTKQFTAAAIMKLAMQGKLEPHDPIGRYLDGVPGDKAGITLHHLLTHSAGVINFTGDDYVMAGREEMLERVFKAPLEFAPGERYSYANAGYSVLAAIVERVSAQPYEHFLQEALFQPAGLRFTGYRHPPWEERVVARWYNGAGDNGTPLEKPYPSWNVMGNGEMLSTTEDLYRWHLALKDHTLLSVEATRQLFTPFHNNYAYGWQVTEEEEGRLIEHGGSSDLGSSAYFSWLVDADILLIVFANQSYNGAPLARLIRDRLFSLISGQAPALPPAVRRAGGSDLASFAGEYALPGGGRLHLTLVHDTLYLAASGQPAINALLFPEAPLTAFADLNRRTDELFAAAVAGDFEPFAHELQDAARAERYRSVIAQYAAAEGVKELGRVQIFHTVPSFVEGAVATEALLIGDGGRIPVSLHWRDGRLMGLSQSFTTEPPAQAVQPAGGDAFTGYVLNSGRVLTLDFQRDRDGRVTGLTLHRPAGDVTAYRQ